MLSSILEVRITINSKLLLAVKEKIINKKKRLIELASV